MPRSRFNAEPYFPCFIASSVKVGILLMTTVVVNFKYHGELSTAVARKLGESFTYLGIRKISVNEREQTIAIEYDATRMDQNGVAAKLRTLGVPIAERVPA